MLLRWLGAYASPGLRETLSPSLPPSLSLPPLSLFPSLPPSLGGLGQSPLSPTVRGQLLGADELASQQPSPMRAGCCQASVLRLALPAARSWAAVAKVRCEALSNRLAFEKVRVCSRIGVQSSISWLLVTQERCCWPLEGYLVIWNRLNSLHWSYEWESPLLNFRKIIVCLTALYWRFKLPLHCSSLWNLKGAVYLYIVISSKAWAIYSNAKCHIYIVISCKDWAIYSNANITVIFLKKLIVENTVDESFKKVFSVCMRWWHSVDWELCQRSLQENLTLMHPTSSKRWLHWFVAWIPLIWSVKQLASWMEGWSSS